MEAMTTAAAHKTNGAARPSALAVFTARCEARALLRAVGEIDLHPAIDELWAAAERDGLVNKLGPDEVQRILADAFAPVRADLLPRAEDDDDSTFAAACEAADAKQASKSPDPHLDKLRQLMADEVTLDRAYSKIHREHFRGRAAARTVEALMLSLRERGTAALAEPQTRRRLATLSSAQVREVLARLIALRPSYPAIDDDLLFLLGEQLS
jgi:hypothetical protein